MASMAIHRRRRWPTGVETRSRGNLLLRVFIERWASLLSGPIESILQVLGADDEDSAALRYASTFAGLLSEQERRCACAPTAKSVLSAFGL